MIRVEQILACNGIKSLDHFSNVCIGILQMKKAHFYLNQMYENID